MQDALYHLYKAPKKWIYTFVLRQKNLRRIYKAATVVTNNKRGGQQGENGEE